MRIKNLLVKFIWILAQPIFPLMILRVNERWGSGINLLDPYFILLEVLYVLDALLFLWIFNKPK